MTRDRPMPAVKALIEKNDKILILKTRVNNGHIWTLPGGRIEYGEEPLEALHREVKEETSLDVDVKDCTGMYHFFMDSKKEEQVVLTAFTAEIKSGIVNIKNNPADENIEGFQWARPESFLDKTDNDSLRQLIQNHYDLT